MGKHQWTNEYMEKFGLAYIKYKALFQPPKAGISESEMKRQKSRCLKSLAKDLGFKKYPSKIFTYCTIFNRKFNAQLRMLLCKTKELTMEHALDRAPPWVRQVEEGLQRLPELTKEVNFHQIVLWSQIVGQVATQMAREAFAARSVRREDLFARCADRDLAQALWVRVMQVSSRKLYVSSSSGDNPLGVREGARMEPHDWLVADVQLLHAPPTLLTQESFLLYEQLQPLIDVFHLVQVYQLEERSHRDPFSLRWTRAHRDYLAKGLVASLVLLQRRWWELKQWTRRGILAKWKKKKADDQRHHLYPIHLAIAKRFPHVVTSPQPEWEELVASGQIIVEPDETNENDRGRRAPIDPSTTALNEAYVETEDDLILIERNIEIVDLEHEDGIPDADDEISVNYEAKEDKNHAVVDKDIACDGNGSTVKTETSDVRNTENIESNIEIINDKGNSPYKFTGKETTDSTVKTTDEKMDSDSDEDDNSMRIDDTCIQEPTILTASDESITNMESNQSENTVLGTTEVTKREDHVNGKDIERETENISSLKDDTQANERDHSETVLEKCDLQNVSIEQDIKPNSNDDKNKQIEPKDSVNVQKSGINNDNIHKISLKNDDLQKSSVKEENNAKDIRDGFIEIEIKNIDEIYLKQEEPILEKLKQLDPDKVEAEILFDSDSDDRASKETSPVPGTSGCEPNELSNNMEESNRDLLIEKKPNESTINKTDENSLVNVKTEVSEESGVRRKRFFFVDDENSSDDDLCIAEIKRKKQLQTLKNKIQFEGDEAMQDDDLIKSTASQRTFELSIIPFSGLSETAQSDLKDLLMQDNARLAEESSRNESFALRKSLRELCATGRPVLQKVQRCDEDDDLVEVASEESTEGQCGRGRAGRRVELPDIEEVRRINGRMLTAQVPPLATVATSHTPRKEEISDGGSDDSASNDTAAVKNVGSMPNEHELMKLLENLHASRKEATFSRSSAHTSYCCLARRHRAVNDAKRRLAVKAGHPKPQLLPLHSGTHLKDCNCCCLHLVEELRREEDVATMQHVLREDLFELAKSNKIGPESWDNILLFLKKAPKRKLRHHIHVAIPNNCKKVKRKLSTEPKANAKKGKDDKRPKLDEAEGDNSADANATSELSNQNSDDDSGWNEQELTIAEECSDHDESETDTRGNSTDKQKPRKKETHNKKKKDKPTETNAEIENNRETTEKATSDDQGYEEWIRQKNLTNRFFGIGPPRKIAANKKGDKSKNIEKHTLKVNSLGQNDVAECSKQNQVPSTSAESADATDKLTSSVNDQVPSTDQHVDSNESLSSIKITSIYGGVVGDIDAVGAPIASIHFTSVVDQSPFNASENIEYTKESTSFIGEMITSQMTLHQLSTPTQSIPNADKTVRVTSGSISGLITSGPGGDRVIASGKIATDGLSSPKIIRSASATPESSLVTNAKKLTTEPMPIIRCKSPKALLTAKMFSPVSAASILKPQAIGTLSNYPSSVACTPTASNIISERPIANIVITPVQNPGNPSTVASSQTSGISCQSTLNFNSNITVAPSNGNSYTPVSTNGLPNIFPKSIILPNAVSSRQSFTSFISQKPICSSTVRSTTPSTVVSKPTLSDVAPKGLAVPCTVVSKPPVRPQRQTGAQSQVCTNASMMKTSSPSKSLATRPSVITVVSGPHTPKMTSKAINSSTAGVPAVNAIPGGSAAITTLVGANSSEIVSGVTPTGQVIRGVREMPRERGVGPAKDVSISRMLNAAMVAAERKLKTMKDVRNLELTINLSGDLPMISFKNNSVQKRVFRVKRVEKKIAEMGGEVAQVQGAPSQVSQDKETVEIISEEESASEAAPKDAAPTAVDSDSDVELISGEHSQACVFSQRPKPLVKNAAAGLLLEVPHEHFHSSAWNPLSTCLPVGRYLEGRDPTTLRLMCLDASQCGAEHFFLTEGEMPVAGAVYCTIAPWRYVEKIVFTEAELNADDHKPRNWMLWDPKAQAPASIAHLLGLGEGGPPDTLTLGDKHYKKMRNQPMVYAQVYSMLVDSRDCRRLLMAGKPLWAYSKTGGELLPITMSPIGPNNVGLMCDDDSAVQELVKKLNMANKFATIEKEQPEKRADARNSIIDVIELDSDGD